MHIVQLSKSDHSAPSGGRSKFGKNTDFCTSDFHLCGRRFHKNCPTEFNEMWYNNYIECVVDAQFSIFLVESLSALRQKIELQQKYRFLQFRLQSMWTKQLGQSFLKDCTAEFKETWHNNNIEVVVDAGKYIFLIRSFSAPW